jgi:hypothetical protein
LNQQFFKYVGVQRTTGSGSLKRNLKEPMVFMKQLVDSRGSFKGAYLIFSNFLRTVVIYQNRLKNSFENCG